MTATICPRAAMKTISIMAFSFFAVLTVPAFADINLNAATALVAIETTDGDRNSFDPGEDFGTIAEGSLIEIIEGSADVSLGEGSQCRVKVGNCLFFLDGGDYVAFSYDSASATCSVKVCEGAVDVRQDAVAPLKNIAKGVDIVFRDV